MLSPYPPPCYVGRGSLLLQPELTYTLSTFSFYSANCYLSMSHSFREALQKMTQGIDELRYIQPAKFKATNNI